MICKKRAQKENQAVHKANILISRKVLNAWKVKKIEMKIRKLKNMSSVFE